MGKKVLSPECLVLSEDECKEVLSKGKSGTVQGEGEAEAHVERELREWREGAGTFMIDASRVDMGDNALQAASGRRFHLGGVIDS